MDKIKWGIFGTGNIAHTFADALKTVENAELYAASSRSDEKAKKFASEYGFKKSMGSYELLAADPEVDIIYIATPMSSHYDDAMMCLRRGKNVLCEKSVSLNSWQLDDIITLAKETGLFFMEAMWLKCRPTYLKALEWAEGGKIGKIKCVKADFCNILNVDKTNRFFNASLGGGALLDLAVYPITLAAGFLGLYPCETVSSAVMGETGVDLTDSIMLRYADGSFADISASFQSDTGSAAVIIGTEGIISMGNGFVWSTEISLYDKNGNLSETFSYENDCNGYEYEIIEAQKCLMNHQTESSLVPHRGTAAVMKIMDTCREQWGMTFPDES